MMLQVALMLPLSKAVARLNLEHFRKLLAEETDQTKRQTILRLRADEEVKLNALTDSPNERKRRHDGLLL